MEMNRTTRMTYSAGSRLPSLNLISQSNTRTFKFRNETVAP